MWASVVFGKYLKDFGRDDVHFYRQVVCLTIDGFKAVSEPRAVATGTYYVPLTKPRQSLHPVLFQVAFMIRSHLPPQAGCPVEGPGPLAVLKLPSAKTSVFAAVKYDFKAPTVIHRTIRSSFPAIILLLCFQDLRRPIRDRDA